MCIRGLHSRSKRPCVPPGIDLAVAEGYLSSLEQFYIVLASFSYKNNYVYHNNVTVLSYMTVVLELLLH